MTPRKKKPPSASSSAPPPESASPRRATAANPIPTASTAGSEEVVEQTPALTSTKRSTKGKKPHRVLLSQEELLAITRNSARSIDDNDMDAGDDERSAGGGNKGSKGHNDLGNDLGKKGDRSVASSEKSKKNKAKSTNTKKSNNSKAKTSKNSRAVASPAEGSSAKAGRPTTTGKRSAAVLRPGAQRVRNGTATGAVNEELEEDYGDKDEDIYSGHYSSSATATNNHLPPSSPGSPPVLLVATAAESREELEAQIRQQLLREAVVAQHVVIDEDHQTPLDAAVSLGGASLATGDGKNNHHLLSVANTDTKATPNRSWIQKNKWMILCGLTLILGVSIGVGVALAVDNPDASSNASSNVSSDNNGISDNTENATMETMPFGNSDELRQFLAPRSPRIMEPNSPQSQAFSWLISDRSGLPNLFGEPTDVYDLWTRYVLATLFFSTTVNGQGWAQDNGWLDGQNVPNFCYWHPGNLCNGTYYPPANRKKTRTKRKTLREQRYLQGGGGGGSSGGGDGGGSGGGTFGGSNMPQPPDSVIRTLDLTNIQLSGTLPEELSILHTLEALVLDGNPLLTGPLIETIGEMKSLRLFSARDVGLTGSSFPSSLSQLQELRIFQMANVTGMQGAAFPALLWTLPYLQVLRLEFMGLTATLPEGELRKSPVEVYLQGNRLSGPLPILDNPTTWENPMRLLDLRDNDLTGSISDGMSRLWVNSLKVLRLEGNSLTGTVPVAVCEAFRARTDADGQDGAPVFSSDCLDNKIVCPCCSLCCLDGAQCQQRTSNSMR